MKTKRSVWKLKHATLKKTQIFVISMKMALNDKPLLPLQDKFRPYYKF